MTKAANTLAHCSTPLEEYWMHVVPQDEMPLAGTPLIINELPQIEARFPACATPSYISGAITVGYLAQWLKEFPELATELRMISSISDKRFYLDMSYIFSRELIEEGGTQTICGCLPHNMKKHSTAAITGFLRRGSEERKNRASEVMANYFLSKGTIGVVETYLSLSYSGRNDIREKWLYPKEVQQNETKRRGHGAEGEIARVLSEAGISLFPSDKATNPMGSADPNVSYEEFIISDRDSDTTFSVDIAVLDTSGKLKAMIMSLVQSSDPGQFGVDKAATNKVIRSRLNTFRSISSKDLQMWGIIDGVGYSENVKGTLIPMIESFDHFIQHNSSFKVLLLSHSLKLCNIEGIYYDPTFYSETSADEMHSKYGGNVKMIKNLNESTCAGRMIIAGKATVWLAE